jgi:hypothetical protein
MNNEEPKKQAWARSKHILGWPTSNGAILWPFFSITQTNQSVFQIVLPKLFSVLSYSIQQFTPECLKLATVPLIQKSDRKKEER